MNYLKYCSFALSLVFGAIFCIPSLAQAQKPFRLLTVETAINPEAKIVLGLEELGLNTGPVFIDTNPILDLGYTANLGAKFIFPATADIKMAWGLRYFKFFGSQAVADPSAKI